MSARATYPRLTSNTTGQATYPQGKHTQVLELHTLDLPLTTSPVKPHTRRANKYTSARATYPRVTSNTARKAIYPQGKQIHEC
jgi:hypothetical protein